MARARSSRLSTGYQPRKWQHEVSANKRRYNVIVVHRRAGKSELGVAELIHEAVHAKATPQNSGAPFFVYLAPYLKQAKVLAWDRLRTYARRLGLTINESELSVSFPHNGAKIQVFGGDNPDALRGVGLDGIVLDELKDLKPEIWYEVVLPALADRRGWAMLIGTPKGVNLLSELYHYGSRKQDWYTAIFTVYQTGVFTAAEIEELRDQMGENEFNREFLCDLTAAGEDQLIGLGLVAAAFAIHHLRRTAVLAPVALQLRLVGETAIQAQRAGVGGHRPHRRVVVKEAEEGSRGVAPAKPREPLGRNQALDRGGPFDRG